MVGEKMRFNKNGHPSWLTGNDYHWDKIIEGINFRIKMRDRISKGKYLLSNSMSNFYLPIEDNCDFEVDVGSLKKINF